MRPDTVPIGSLPPVGVVPKRMLAQVIRRENYGDPSGAFRIEEIEVPEIKEDEILIAVMSAGVNYNNVFAARGYPLDLIDYRLKQGDPFDFHIGGSEAAGIVYRTGSGVKNFRLGDEVVIQGGVWDVNDPEIRAGGDVVLSPGFKAWGFETNWGSFAQFCVVKEYQCLPKPKNLSWDESAVYMLTGATAYRMLFHWQPNTLRSGEPVLIWGGAGGLGVMAIQIVREFGGIPVAVVNSDDKKDICADLGAQEVINRNNYSHWGAIPSVGIESSEFNNWMKEAKRFGKAILEITGGRAPSIVVEHPGESTFPTSLFVCKPGGMVVTCGGTSGYTGSFDLRYLWMKQKRIQGSHFASPDQCEEVNRLVRDGRIKPVVSKVFDFEEIPHVHQLMYENRHPYGNMAIRVGFKS